MTQRFIFSRTAANLGPAVALIFAVASWCAAQSQGEADFNPAHIVRTYSVHHSTPLQIIPESDFSVTLTQDDATPLGAVLKALADHKSAGLPGSGDYQAVEKEHRIDVVPYQVLGVDGSEHRVTPVMSHAISFPKMSRSITATFDLIASQISLTSGKKVVVANQPYYRMDGTAELDAAAELPGDVIEKLADQLGTVFSYQVRYENRVSTYYLSIYPVVNQKIYGTLKNNKAPGTQVQSSPNPFFKKDQ